MKNRFFFILAMLLVSCVYDPAAGSVAILNYTDKAVYVYATCSDKFPGREEKLVLFETNHDPGMVDACGKKMRDTISPTYRINAYNWGSLRAAGTSDKPKIPCNNKNWTFFFIKEEIMKTKTWAEICKKQLFDKKIVLTQEKLDRACWRITYETVKN